MTVTNPNPPEGEHPWSRQPETSLTLLKHLSDGEFILGYYNLSTQDSGDPLHLRRLRPAHTPPDTALP